MFYAERSRNASREKCRGVRARAHDARLRRDRKCGARIKTIEFGEIGATRVTGARVHTLCRAWLLLFGNGFTKMFVIEMGKLTNRTVRCREELFFVTLIGHFGNWR